MILAISGGVAYILLIIIAVVIVTFPINRAIKKNEKNKLKQQDMMNDLNSFILKYEAEKSRAEKAKAEEEAAASEKAETEEETAASNVTEAETPAEDA